MDGVASWAGVSPRWGPGGAASSWSGAGVTDGVAGGLLPQGAWRSDRSSPVIVSRQGRAYRSSGLAVPVPVVRPPGPRFCCRPTPAAMSPRRTRLVSSDGRRARGAGGAVSAAERRKSRVSIGPAVDAGGREPSVGPASVQSRQRLLQRRPLRRQRWHHRRRSRLSPRGFCAGGAAPTAPRPFRRRRPSAPASAPAQRSSRTMMTTTMRTTRRGTGTAGTARETAARATGTAAAGRAAKGKDDDRGTATGKGNDD